MDDSDHRAIGNRLDLFHQQEEGPGMVFWHPRGTALYRVVEETIRRRMAAAGFREVRTPQLLSRSLWERSGHWAKFGDAIFAFGEGERVMALKPMSCPGHVQIFNKRVRSHRDLPVRLCEFGACHRNEPSGALQGLMRTRAFVQDDAHIFCREDQVEEEVARFCRMLAAVYADFGFPGFSVGFSTRPALRAGSEEAWDKAEAMLAAAARAAGLSPRLQPGEGAFYGPKLEFILKDRHGRDWQCGTVQLDLVLPERLDAEYVDSENRRVRPVMIHHAVLGSIERFVAILLEHHGGALPFWLAPEQVAVAPVDPADAGQAAYARHVVAELSGPGLRAVLDDRPERLPRRIVDAHANGIPVFVAVGARELGAGTVSVRRRNAAPVALPLARAVADLAAEARP
ncbi:threonine--tRNA ligase [Arenibaculum pallidiluteum]|uniref:threonine--tRNA ligase n=1 Tax=Arenibaculum pallidiluteum TaxID=2812559 RepID=UPI001A96DAE5|nr:threonine--tRNA ligase [Arenibaculum pallidiluteum]